jgi:predicted metal-dependent HD superfamily phosphohydrolase
MFEFARRHALGLSVPERLAVWYHDCIYDPTAGPGENEARSAEHMGRELEGLPLEPSDLEMAAGIVLSTAHHTRDDLPPAHDRVMDLDLASFTAPPEVFDRQSAALRLEFTHVSDADYAAADFLRGLLDRRRIFRTPQFARHEVQARRQIEQEMHRLQAVRREASGVRINPQAAKGQGSGAGKM